MSAPHAAVPDGLAALSAVVVWVWSAGRHAVSQRHPDCLSTTCKHAVESFGFFGIDRVGVAVHPDQPNQTSTGSWIHLAPCRVVMNQGHCIRERIPGLPLCPVDDLENVSSSHVVGVSPPIRGFWATAVQVDPESEARIFPSGIALIDLYNLNLAHGRQSCSRRPKPPHIGTTERTTCGRCVRSKGLLRGLSSPVVPAPIRAMAAMLGQGGSVDAAPCGSASSARTPTEPRRE